MVACQLVNQYTCKPYKKAKGVRDELHNQICFMSYKIGCSHSREQIIQLGSADLMPPFFFARITPPNALSSETNNKLHKPANIHILWNINETKISH